MKQKLFFASLFLIPLMFFILLESILRLSGFGTGYPLYQPVNDRQYRINRQYPRLFFTSARIATPEAITQTFLKQKPADGLRLVCLGGSTTAGFPFEVNINFPYFLQKNLERQFPAPTVEVLNLGMSAVNSHAVRFMIDKIVKLEPDAVVIYMGHNEFYGALGLASNEWLGQSPTLIQSLLHIRTLRTYQLVSSAVATIAQRLKSDAGQSGNQPTLMEAMIGKAYIPPDGAIVRRTKHNFEQNLDHILRTLKQNEIPVLLSTLTSNLKDQQPLDDGDKITKNAHLKEQFEEGRQLQKSGTWRRAISVYKTMLKSDSLLATVHFQLGRCYLQTGQAERAYIHFRKARDWDAVPFRAPTYMNAIIRRTANKHSCSLAEIDSSFRDFSQDHIPGNNLFLEHLHPNDLGYRLMARTFLRQLADILAGQRIQKTIQMKDWQALYTELDVCIGALKIEELLNRPPFVKHNRFTLPDMPYPEIRKVASSYLANDLYWDGAHFRLGDYFTEQSLLHRAIREFRVVLDYDSTHISALNRLGNSWYQLENWKKALSYYKRAIRHYPQKTFLYAKAGQTVLRSEQSPQRALQYLTRALQLNKQQNSLNSGALKQLHYLLALAYFRNEQQPQAQKHVKAVLSMDARYQPAIILQKRLSKQQPK